MGEGPSGVDLDGIAQLDLGRAERRGYPEAIFCEGKTADQVARIASALADQPQVSLFTRVRDEHVAAITAVLPDAAVDLDARLVAWPPMPPAPTGGEVLVLAAGTSDLPVAR
jgi:NCAIR mutase (PurE)-related protein